MILYNTNVMCRWW